MANKLIVVVPSVVGDRPRWWLWHDADSKYERGAIDGDCSYAVAHICDDLHTTTMDECQDRFPSVRPDAAIISIEVDTFEPADDGDPDELELCEEEQRG